MTPELEKALEAWCDEPIGKRPTRAEHELKTAYRAAKEQSPRFEVGQRVRVKGAPVAYEQRICGARTYALDDGRIVLESDLVAIPTLPPDHIDRFWTPGAILQHNDGGTAITVINSEWGAQGIGGAKPMLVERRGVCELGWSFADDSPVKEEVEP